MSNVKFNILPIAFGIACMSSGNSFAADQAASAVAPATAGIEEVIITAQKVQESQQSVPIAVVAFSPKEIENKAILNIQDLGKSMTGVVISESAQGNAPTFSIRGNRIGHSIDGGVAVYFNDTPLTEMTSTRGVFFDLADIETLKGPQGTLFGVNATGGAVSFRSNLPTDKFEGYVDVGIGNYNRQEFEGMINIPVNDVLQVRLAAQSVRRDGYVHNITAQGSQPKLLNDEKHDSARLSIRLKPSSTLTNDLIIDGYSQDAAGSANIPTVFAGSTVAYAAALGINLNYVGPGTHWNTLSTGGNRSGVVWPIFAKDNAWGAQNITNWEISDNASIKNVLGYRYDKVETAQDDDGTPFNLVNGHDLYLNKEWIDDFTLKLNTDDKRLRVVSGIVLKHFDEGKPGQSYVLAEAPVSLGTAAALGVPVSAVAGFALETPGAYDRVFKSHALYSQAEYDLTRELTATFGLRYNWDSGSYTAHNQSKITNKPDPTFYPTPGFPCATNTLVGSIDLANCKGSLTGKWQAPGFNFVITDKFAERSLIYAKISGGYDQGGFNNAIREPQYQTFQPEKNVTFETGIKSDWELWGRPIRTNFDVFYGNSKNKQEETNGSYADGAQWTAVFNAGSLNYYGFDFEGKYNVTDSLSLELNWTHIESEYVSFQFPAVGTLVPRDLSGSTPAQIAKDSLTGSATVKWPVASNVGKIESTLGFFYRDKVTWEDVQHTPSLIGPAGNLGPAYTIFNFTTNWKGIMGSNFDASFWVKNLTDKYYIMYYNDQTATLGYGQIARGDPRMFGAHLRYNF